MRVFDLRESPDGVPPVSLRIAAVPFPGGSNDVLDLWMTGRPSQLLDDLLRRRDQDPRIAWPAAGNFMSDRPANHLLARAKNLEYGRAGSRTHVIRPAHTRLQTFDGQLMRLGQIFGMNIVPHAGSITGW